MDGDETVSGYKKLGEDLWRRTCDPFFHPPFVFFVVTGVILFGGLGIWVELAKYLTDSHGDLNALLTAVITFFSTLAGASTIQLNYASYNKSDKVMGSFALLLMCLFVTTALVLFLLAAKHSIGVAVAGTLCSFVAVWVWWITNAWDDTFLAITSPDAAVGGPTDKTLPGSLDGFQH